MPFKIADVGIIDLDPGSFKYECYVQYTFGEKAGLYLFCILKVSEDAKGQTPPL